MNTSRIKQFCCAIALLLLAQSIIAGQLFYVFKDNRGRTVIQDSIPAEYVNKGYKIVNELGTTLKVIPSVAEQQRTNEAALERSRANKVLAKRREVDQRLLNSFSNVEDIREAGNKKIIAIQTQIDITTGHIKAFEDNLARLEEQLLTKNEKNLKVSASEIEAIEQVKTSIQENKDFIERKIVEQQNIKEEYIEYIRRYQKLSAK